MQASFSSTERGAILKEMASGVDVLVIGGGITGAGVALDAASRGFRVALVERADFASGTSSRSTKLVHGGIRYLPQMEFDLVREGLIERALLVENAPHLVRPLPFVMPFYSDAVRPLGIRLPAAARPILPASVRIGLWMYDALAGRRLLLRHRSLSAREASFLVPSLRTLRLRNAFLYYDGQTDDARLTMAVVRTAVRHGALCLNYVQAAGVTRSGGRVDGASVRDRLSGEEARVPARFVVNAAGIWAGEVARLASPSHRLGLTVSKGVHLVLPKEVLRLGETAVVLPETEDGRLGFVVPWEGQAVLGTTDTAYSGPFDEPPVEREDVDYLLRHARRFLDVELQPGDVVGAYAGLRPLASASTRSSADVSRRHSLIEHEPGFLSIVGGKLTTYRRMAQDVVDRIARAWPKEGSRSPGGRGHEAGASCRTERLRLVGGESADAWEEAVRETMGLGVPSESVSHLLRAYGSELAEIASLVREEPDLGRPLAPGLPYVRAEVVFAARHTMAVHLEDVLVRRLRLSVVDDRAARLVAGTACTLMARELGWSPDRQHHELAACQATGGD